MLGQTAIIALAAFLTLVDAHPHQIRKASSAHHVDKRATTAPTVKGWTYSGCVIDGGARALSAKNMINGGMTAEMCTSWCAGQGYVYAGLEAKNQCFCDSQLRNGLGTSTAESECNYQCTGDATQPCGGYYRMNLYRSGSAAAPTSSKASTTSTSTSKTSTTTAKTFTTTTSKASTTTTKTTSATTATVTERDSAATYYGCYQDSSSSRLMNSASTESSSMTPSVCQTFCSSKGYSLAGVSYGKQCFCGNSVDQTKKQSSESGCSYACTGDKNQKCGGFWYLNIYSSSGTISVSSAVTSTTSTSTTSKASSVSTTSKSSSTSTTATSTTSAGPVASSAIGAPSPPAATGTKQLFAHHMVGNTYSYSQSTWADDISQAYAAGIDGFALNYGGDSWQPARLSDAYAAATAQGKFKMFLSMDVSSLGCGSTTDAQNLVNTIATYANNTAQAKVGGKVLVSTFAGESCKFGQSTYQAAWNYFDTLIKAKSIDIYFVPAVFADTSTFANSTWMDGEFNWNSAWPMGGSALGTYSDTSYMSALGSKGYMAGVSPAFFTYYSPSTWNKNWIYRGDDWLLARRMEQIIQMRNQFDLAEIISWNDYGESHYIGPIRADQPNSQGWTNGMPHTAWLEVIKYYAPAFKTGSYPSANDQLVLWTRPHPKAATATSPSMSRPTGWDNTDDLLYVWVVLKSAATVTVTSGSNTASWNLNAGVNKVSVKSAAGTISAKIVRSGFTVKSYDSTGSFTYTTSPSDYNYNYFVASA
ncbi:hypothetical protein I302_107556 [Kwoniella bestiolae CBS 10118]|uniref:WSC domain-containing protein n=1 Tax=Kwoniella bestiolae CBS 10118 TaxID=1296100 RepID=A0A1B9FY73_9TREE|nr:hypothetical protein I302_06702 [Kwoniella bestiolae CBS 10118]OCF23719.1 hypothetical protein I302_06702 [Kwoniella bestiolae CBS 10118]